MRLTFLGGMVTSTFLADRITCRQESVEHFENVNEVVKGISGGEYAGRQK